MREVAAVGVMALPRHWYAGVSRTLPGSRRVRCGGQAQRVCGRLRHNRRAFQLPSCSIAACIACTHTQARKRARACAHVRAPPPHTHMHARTHTQQQLSAPAISQRSRRTRAGPSAAARCTPLHTRARAHTHTHTHTHHIHTQKHACTYGRAHAHARNHICHVPTLTSNTRRALSGCLTSRLAPNSSSTSRSSGVSGGSSGSRWRASSCVGSGDAGGVCRGRGGGLEHSRFGAWRAGAPLIGARCSPLHPPVRRWRNVWRRTVRTTCNPIWRSMHMHPSTHPHTSCTLEVRKQPPPARSLQR